MILFADTSVLVAAYMPDESAHESAKGMVFGRGVACSALARVEFHAAMGAFFRSGRIPDERGLDSVSVRFEADCRRVISPVPFEAEAVFARSLPLTHYGRVRTLDALHIAAALVCGKALGESPRFLTGDRQQGLAATSAGLDVWTLEADGCDGDQP